MTWRALFFAVVAGLLLWAGIYFAVRAAAMPAPDPAGRACRVQWVCRVASACTEALEYPIVVCPRS